MKQVFTLLAAMLISGLSFGQSIQTDVQEGCAPLNVHASCVANNPLVKYYRWIFDYNYNNHQVLSKDTSVIFTGKGYHSISVNMYDKDHNYLGYASNYAYVDGLSDISYSKKACPGDNVSIDYDGHGVTLTYNFGDGSPASNKNSHSYSHAGKYTITVIGKSSCGADTIQDTIRIADNLKMSGYFDVYASASKLCPTQPMHFSFYSENNNPFVADLGDGTQVVNSTYINHTYATEGTFIYSAKFTNGCGSDTTIKNTITVSKTNPWEYGLQIYKGKSLACPNEQISFSVNTTITRVEWTFGDGGSAVGISLDHLFKNTGKYYLTAKVTNYCGRDTLLKDSIEIKGNLPIGVTNNVSMDDNLCPNSNVGFQYYGSSVASLNWDFGDKDSAQTSYTNHTYTALGDYPVTLTLRNGCGADTVFKYTVHIIDKPADISFLTLSTDKVCPGDRVHVTGYSQDVKSYKVDFGDGYFTNNYYDLSHQYLKSGNYPVKTEVTNYCGNKASRVDTIHITNNAKFTQPYFPNFSNASICPGDIVSFQTDYYPSVSWDFGNGQKAYGANATTSYSAAGTYNYSVKLVNGCGVDTTLKSSITIGNSFSIPYLYLYAYYPVANTGTDIQFRQYSNTSMVKWNFGDSATSTVAYPVHSYKKEGTYYAKVTITNGCNNSKTDSLKVIISDALLAITPKITKTPMSSCPGDAVQFSTDYALDNYIGLTTYDLNCDKYETTWQFADGNESGYIVSKVFQQAGKYPYSVRIKNKSGQEITVKDTVVVGTANTIKEGTVVIQGDTKKCLGDSAYFTLVDAEKSYEIDFGDGYKTSTFWEKSFGGPALKIVGHKYATEGIYKVKVKATNGCGDAAYDSIAISIDPYKGASNVIGDYNVDESRTYCKGEKVKFSIYEASNVSIDFGDGEKQIFNKANFSTIKHAYKTSNTYKVIVKAFDACNDTTVYTNTISVDTCQALPDEVLSIEKGVMRCYPNPVQDKLIIELADGNAKDESEYILFDLNGRKILEGRIPKGSASGEIHLSQLSTGIYLLRVSSENKTSVIKVIKQ